MIVGNMLMYKPLKYHSLFKFGLRKFVSYNYCEDLLDGVIWTYGYMVNCNVRKLPMLGKFVALEMQSIV